MKDGFLTVLKPPGMTSNNVVYDVRRILQEKKVGHLGTLDPGAAGVLPVSFGRATRLFDYLVEKEKEYLFEILFGNSTDTLDVFGRVTASDPGRVISERELTEILPDMTGEQEQKVPAYSALKVDGQKMYDLARAGLEIADKVHTVRIHELELLRQISENRFLLRVRCSKGTYVRQLCSDIAEKLGTAGCMSFLLRTGTGHFMIENAHTIPEISEAVRGGNPEKVMISCEDALCDYPALELPLHRRVPSMNGLETDVRTEDGIFRIYCGGFLGLGEVKNKKMRMTVHLY